MYITRVNQPVMTALTPRINIRTDALKSKSFTPIHWTNDCDRVHTRTGRTCQARCSHIESLTHPRHPNTPGPCDADGALLCTHDDNFPRLYRSCRCSVRSPLHAAPATSF